MSESAPTIVELTQKYLQALTAGGARPMTIQAYSGGLKTLIKFLGRRSHQAVQQITAGELAKYQLSLAKRGLASASQDLYLRSVRCFFRWLEERHLIFQSPATGLSCPLETGKLQPVPTEEEVARLLAQPDTSTAVGLRDRALFELAYATGARRGELCRLQVQDLDLDHGTVRILGKGGRERVVPLGRAAGHWIQQYLRTARPKLLQGGTDTSLWINTFGRPVSYPALDQVRRCHAKAAKLKSPISLHALRRACATHMLQHGAHPAQIQKLLGHASPITINRYLRLTVKDLKATHRQSRPGQ